MLVTKARKEKKLLTWFALFWSEMLCCTSPELRWGVLVIQSASSCGRCLAGRFEGARGGGGASEGSEELGFGLDTGLVGDSVGNL